VLLFVCCTLFERVFSDCGNFEMEKSRRLFERVYLNDRLTQETVEQKNNDKNTFGEGLQIKDCENRTELCENS
jgi:hypothetical protein